MPNLDELEDLLRQKKNKEALELIRKDKGLTAQNLIEDGILFSITGEYNLSFAYFDLAEKFAEDEDTKKLAKVNLGVAYNKRGCNKYLSNQYNRAIDDFTEAITIDPEDADTYYNRGRAYSALKRFKNAIEDYTAAIDLYQKTIIDLIVTMALNNEEVYYIIPAKELNKALSNAYNNRGEAYSELKKHDNAVGDFIMAVETLRSSIIYNGPGSSNCLLKNIEKNIDEIDKIRSQFEVEVKSILGIGTEELQRYFEEKCLNLNDCNTCNAQYLIKERGLTKENISIYLRFIKIFGGNSHSYCLGADADGFVLCYGRDMIPIITRIHKEIFSQISIVAYTLSVCHTEKQHYASLISKASKKTTKFWNIAEQGVLALNNAYRRTKFKNSKDILHISLPYDELVFLHGHQLNDFLRGQRSEQKQKRKYPHDSISIVQMGHFHHLGVFTFNGFDGLIVLVGSLLYPERGYFPEMLSQMGTIKMRLKGSKIRFVIHRLKISNEQIKDDLKRHRKKPWTFRMKMDLFRKICQSCWYIVPGNHDSFDEVYMNKAISKIEDLLSASIGLGDYIEFTLDEFYYAKKCCLELLKAENFEQKIINSK